MRSALIGRYGVDVAREVIERLEANLPLNDDQRAMCCWALGITIQLGVCNSTFHDPDEEGAE